MLEKVGSSPFRMSSQHEFVDDDQRIDQYQRHCLSPVVSTIQTPQMQALSILFHQCAILLLFSNKVLGYLAGRRTSTECPDARDQVDPFAAEALGVLGHGPERGACGRVVQLRLAPANFWTELVIACRYRLLGREETYFERGTGPRTGRRRR
jgi:hypothetical protein